MSRLCVTLIGSHKINGIATVCTKCIILLINRLILFYTFLVSFTFYYSIHLTLICLLPFVHQFNMKHAHRKLPLINVIDFSFLSSIKYDRYRVFVVSFLLFRSLFLFRFLYILLFHPFRFCIVNVTTYFFIDLPFVAKTACGRAHQQICTSCMWLNCDPFYQIIYAWKLILKAQPP